VKDLAFFGRFYLSVLLFLEIFLAVFGFFYWRFGLFWKNKSGNPAGCALGRRLVGQVEEPALITMATKKYLNLPSSSGVDNMFCKFLPIAWGNQSHFPSYQRRWISFGELQLTLICRQLSESTEHPVFQRSFNLIRVHQHAKVRLSTMLSFHSTIMYHNLLGDVTKKFRLVFFNWFLVHNIYWGLLLVSRRKGSLQHCTLQLKQKKTRCSAVHCSTHVQHCTWTIHFCLSQF